MLTSSLYTLEKRRNHHPAYAGVLNLSSGFDGVL